MVEGPLTVHLSSPDNHLTLRSHRLRLTPLGDGSHRAEVVADFSGAGHLVARVELAGAVSRLDDDVEVPPQTRTVVARVVIARDADGGYRVTPLEMPPSLPVTLHSGLAGRLGDLCGSFALLPGFGLDCAAVRGALSTANVPLPAPGETFPVPTERLSAGDRARLDAYLARARDAG